MALSIEELRHAIRIQKHLVANAGMDEREAYHLGIVVLENRDKIQEILSDLQPIEPKTPAFGSVTSMNLENMQHSSTDEPIDEQFPDEKYSMDYGTVVVENDGTVRWKEKGKNGEELRFCIPFRGRVNE